MRLIIHFCDDSPKAENKRIKEGKKYVKCKSKNESSKFYENNIFGLDIDTDSPTLGKSSTENL